MKALAFDSRGNLRDLGPRVDNDPLLSAEERLLEVVERASETTNDDQLDRLGQELDNLEATICKSVPSTPCGIAVKVRQLWECAKEDADTEDYENIRTILEGLNALARNGKAG